MQSKWQRSQRCPRRPCKVVKIMIDSKLVMQLRAQTGAGVLEAKHALEESGGDIEKAVEVLRKSGAIKAAKKSLRQGKKRKAFNAKRKNNVKDLFKRVKSLIAEKKNEEAKKLLPVIYKALDKAVKTGVIKKNNASRRKSRIAKSLSKA